MPREPVRDRRPDAVVLHEPVRERLVAERPVAVGAAVRDDGGTDARRVVLTGDAHLRDPRHLEVERRQPVSGVAGTADDEPLVEAVDGLERLAGERRVAAVDVVDGASADGPFLWLLGRPPHVELPVNWAGDRVGLPEAVRDGGEPPLLDGEFVREERDDVAASPVDARVARDVHVPVVEFDQHVHVVAFTTHPTGPVGRGAVDDDGLGGRFGRERVETGREPVAAVERRDYHRDIHTVGYHSRWVKILG